MSDLPSSSSSSYPTSSQYTSYFPTPFHLQQQQQHQSDPTTSAYPAAAPSQYYPSAAPSPYYSSQQAQQLLFQRDAQTITPEALQTVKAALASSSEIDKTKETKKPKAIPRIAGGQTWEDPTLTEWPENDYRLFCGNLGNEVNDEILTRAFSKFPSLNMAKVVRDKKTGKTKGYGFISFANVSDFADALKKMNGSYVGNRPIKLVKGKWKERTDVEALERQKNITSKKQKKNAKKSVLHK